MAERNSCFHCGEAIPSDVHIDARIGELNQAVCCHGCQAVAELIDQSGLGDFYRFREQLSARADQVESNPQRWAFLDRDAVLTHHARALCDGHYEITLVLENIHCAACAWLIQRYLRASKGVLDAAVDVASGHLRLVYDPSQAPLSGLADGLQRLGYRPHLDNNDQRIERDRQERRAMLMRVAIAGLGMMQVMSYALAIYIGAVQDLDAQTEQFFHVVSLIVALPICAYAGWPFYSGAWRYLRNRRLGMDVPVAAAMLIALTASVINTLRGSGEVYFDSVIMFIFFLLLGRYAVLRARQSAGDVQSALASSLPQQVQRLNASNQAEPVAMIELQLGDRVLVPAGERLPGDGVIEHGEAMVDEALLSGESRPNRRRQGDQVLAGSINRDGTLTVRIEALGANTSLGRVVSLLGNAVSQRPEQAVMADRLSRFFIAFVLTGAVIAGLAWHFLEPSMALPVMLSVLVVSCPCALALGTPTALAAGSRRLAGLGVLVPRPDRLEQFTRLTDVVLDKTGTLTSDRMRVCDVRPAPGWSEQALLRQAARLEQHSNHPIARAIVERDRCLSGALDTEPAHAVAVQAGDGVMLQDEQQQWRIGKPEYVAELLAGQAPQRPGDGIWVAIAGGQAGLVGWLRLDSPLRSGLDELLKRLRQRGLRLHLASGDRQCNVDAIARQFAFDSAQGELSPTDKLDLLQRLRGDGRMVAMIGDGINDGPVLAAADMAIALAEGSAVAHTQADLILTGTSLQPLAEAVELVPLIRQRVRQNLAWALSYNIMALPLAAFGMVPPWLAAIGMSASSLLVVLNAQRLKRQPSDWPGRPRQAARLGEAEAA